MTNEERQALIADCENEINAIKVNIRWLRNNDEAANVKEWESKLSRQELALDALAAEPVKVPDEKPVSNDKLLCDNIENYGWNACRAEVLRLNAIDNTAQQYETLAGWKMVPVEPSKEMRSQIHPIADGNCSHCGNRTTLDCEENMLLSWRDMLEAAPKPED